MLGWIFLGALLGAAIVITVSYLNKDTLTAELEKRNTCKTAWVRDIVINSGVAHISLDSYDISGNEQKIEIQAESINENEIYKGLMITL